MVNERDYALLSNSVYSSTKENEIDPEVLGWDERKEWRKDDPVTG